MAYIISIICIGTSYAIAALGLNLQWGYTGLFNIGVAAFFAVGAYTSAILTGPVWGGMIGGFGLPYLVGLVGAVLFAALLAYLVAWILRLEFGFLAIASIMLSAVVILILKNEMWLTNGVWGIGGIPRPFGEMLSPSTSDWVYMIISLVILIGAYFLLERGVRSPWGRTQRIIKEDPILAEMAGKDVYKWRRMSWIIGSMYMGLAGAVYGHYIQYINPKTFDDVMITFLCLCMVVIGGSGNNKGSILGAYALWVTWTVSEILTGYLPEAWQLRAPFIRVLIIGVAIILLLRLRPQGLIGRETSISKMGERIRTGRVE